MTAFPMATVEIVHERFAELMRDRVILDRRLRPSDPARSIGIFPVDWSPVRNSMEIGGPNRPPEPTLQTYQYRIQSLVKHTDEIEGRALYALDAKFVLAILYRDQDLRVRLTTVQETLLGSVERVQRFGVNSQRYLNNELSGQFIYLATTEFWVETETVPT